MSGCRPSGAADVGSGALSFVLSGSRETVFGHQMRWRVAECFWGLSTMVTMVAC